MEDENVWKKFHTIWRNQGARHNSLERKDCCFTNQGHAIVLYDTPPAVSIEKVVCMKTKDELFKKARLTPRVPRVVLKSNSKICLQDQREKDARTSCDQSSGSHSTWETGSNTVDYRISGVPLSAVEQQGAHRKDKVKKFIE